MFFNSVYFLQQPLIFVVITILLLRYNMPHCYSSTKKAQIKNKIYIMPYRNKNTIIPLANWGVRDVFLKEYVFDFKMNMLMQFSRW